MSAAAGFTSWLHCVQLPEWEGFRPRFALTKPLMYYSALIGRTIAVPVGFVADGESSPAYASFTGPMCLHAGFLHDYLTQAHLPGIDKATADAVYLEALRSVGLEDYWARQRHYMVTQYGQGAWDAGPTRLRIIALRDLADAQRPYGVLDAPKPEPNVSEPARVEA